MQSTRCLFDILGYNMIISWVKVLLHPVINIIQYNVCKW